MNEIDGSPIDGNARKVVVLIHGWNPDNSSDQYETSDQWFYLKNILRLKLLSTDWKLTPFHWERTAATGSVWQDVVLGEFVTENATQSAEHAVVAGEYLAMILNRSAPELRQVHLIAHSAGSWAARSAAQSLLNLNSAVIVQITLLDPYIPVSISPHSQSTNAMSDLIYSPAIDRINRLENYFAKDAPLNDQATGPGWNAFGNIGPTIGTQNSFVWRSGRDVNAQIDWSPPFWPATYSKHYDYHAGPIEFYADTVKASIPGQSVEPGLSELYCPFSYAELGWSRSLYEAIGILPRFTIHPQTTSASSGSSVTLTSQALRANSYQWFRNGQPVNGATGGSHILTVNEATAGKYTVRATNQNGVMFSDAALVAVQTPPPDPGTTYYSITASTGPNGSISPSGTFSRSAGSTVNLTAAASSGYEVASWYVNGLLAQSGGPTYTIPNLQASTSVQVTFRLVTVLVLTGDLLVNITPVAAVNAGAQWRFLPGGTYQTPNVPFQNLGPGQYQIGFKSIAGYNTPPDQTITVVANQQTPVTGNYTASSTTYYLSINSDHGQVTRNPNRNTFSPGETVRLTASAAPGWHFDHWSGDASGSSSFVDVVMSSDKSVTANFAAGDYSVGAINVVIQPSGAVAAGARWRDNGGVWTNSGVTLNSAYVGTHYLEFNDVPGWNKPAAQQVAVVGGQTTNVVANYTQDSTAGTLIVTITPPAAATAGAKWRVNNGPPQNSGASVSLVPGSAYTVTFDSVSGWSAPQNQSITIQPGGTTLAIGNYTPPAGQPIIVSIRPPVGSLAGGTALTIDGANFSDPSTVLVDGRPATNVTVLSASQITCLTPSNSVYGTVPVVVQTSGGSATNQNGFTYGVPRGSGLELAGSIGGYVYAVAAQGANCFYGEGSSFVVLNISNPASPVPVGRLPMPGLVRDIALLPLGPNQYACVAAADAGLQIVEVTTPSLPRLRGQYITPGRALGVYVLGGYAYVAMENAGLGIFDLSNPAAPRLMSSIATGGYADKVVVKASAQGTFAYVSSDGKLRVVDVSNPEAPALRGQTPNVSKWYYLHSLAVSGNRALLADGGTYVKVVDISNPDTPSVLSDYGDASYSSVAIIGSRVYLKWGSLEGFEVADIIGGNLQLVGRTFTGPTGSGGNNLAVAGGYAFCAIGEFGLALYDMSSPAAPTYRTAVDTVSGAYLSVALNGTTVIAATQNRGMKIFNAANSANPILRSQFIPASGGGTKVEYSSSQAFFSGGLTLRIVDVSNPDSPVLQGTTTQSQFLIYDFFLRGGYVAVSGQNLNDRAALAFVNPIPPSAPSIYSQLELDLDSGSGGVAVCGNTSIACVAVIKGDGTCSLKIVNVSNPQAPTQIGQLPDIGKYVRTMKLAPNNRYLHIGRDEDANWVIVDLLNPAAPVLLNSNALNISIYGFDFNGNTAFVAAGSRGVLVYDVSNPVHPLLLRSYDTPTSASDVKVSGEKLYAADYEGGLVILGLSDIESPQVFITTPTALPNYTNTSGTLNLWGGAYDNLSVTRVTWSNSRGGGADASLNSDSWIASGVALQPGSNILTVTAFDAAGNSSSDSLMVFYQTPKQNQSIIFPAIANRTFGDAPITLAASASSGLNVEFQILSGPASLSGTGLTLTSAGTVTVRAMQPGSDQFNSAATDVTFNVAKAEQSIAFPTLAGKSLTDPPFIVNATASSGLAVQFTLVSGPATMNSNLITLTGAGVITVRATQSGNTNFNPAAEVQRSFTVAKLPQFITFSTLGRQVFGDVPFALSATVSSGLQVEFTVLSGPATVSAGIATLTGPGLVVLRASQSGNATYAPAPNADQVLIVAPGHSVITESRRFPDGRFNLVFAGEFNQPYVVEFSTNLTSWLPLVTNAVNGVGNLEFTDAGAMNRPQSFYRVRTQ